jgi:DNA-binding response OmpR family regulator
MILDDPTQVPQTIALVCAEPRLRRILRLALEIGGYTVRDCPHLWDLPALGAVVAAVVDLDSLRPLPIALGPQPREYGLPDALPTIFISVYPAEVAEQPRSGPTDYLQPPFPADEIASRVGRLLRASGQPHAADGLGGSLSPT